MFAAARFQPNIEFLDAADAERLAAACAQHGSDWFEARTTIDLEAATKLVDERLFGPLEEQFEEFVEDIRRQNEDRADLQLRNLRRHLGTQRRRMIDVRERHRVHGRESLVKATDGRIQALENRVKRKDLEIERRRGITYRNDEVVVALVRID